MYIFENVMTWLIAVLVGVLNFIGLLVISIGGPVWGLGILLGLVNMVVFFVLGWVWRDV